jgi:CBS domain-containing protein
MNVGECMKRKVITIHSSATLSEAATLLVKHHVGTLPVVDDEGHLEGLLLLRHLISLVLPDFVNLLDDFDFVHDFGAVEHRRPKDAALEALVTKVMEKPISVDTECSLLRAVSILLEQNLTDLPVVDRNNKLLGIVSRVDLGTWMIRGWNISPGG